jgi:uncharacterized protein
MVKHILAATCLAGMGLCTASHAQNADPQLLAEIQKIKAIDNHSHPPKVVSAGEKDDDFDALPCDPLEPSTPTTISRPENPQYIAAWKALYGYQHDDAKPEHVREVLAAKKKVRDEQGDNFPNWVLDQLGIESELANRIALGRGLQAPRFRWVPFDDALLFPLKTSELASESPDRKFFFSRETYLLRRYLKDLDLDGLPGTLQEYLSKVVTPTLEAQKKNGAVAIKFEAAYLRSLDFGQPEPIEVLARTYQHFVKEGIPIHADYVRLQNALFRYVAKEAGRLGMAVHLHTGGGCGTYFYLSGSNPALLDSVINEADLRKTTFVLVHGGAGTFSKQASYLMMKPNVYVDFSEQTWLISTRALSQVIREWIEWYPEKVLFGTDLYPNTAEIDWEEIGWQTTQSGREALAIALSGMMDDKEISRERALEIAHMVMHDNAARIYGLSR